MTIPSKSSAVDTPSPVDEAQLTRSKQEAENGTLYQNVIGTKAPRKHFFSPLDPTLADAVHQDAETVQYSPEDEVG
jgi:hypothetical protein